MNVKKKKKKASPCSEELVDHLKEPPRRRTHYGHKNLYAYRWKREGAQYRGGRGTETHRRNGRSVKRPLHDHSGRKSFPVGKKAEDWKQ